MQHVVFLNNILFSMSSAEKPQFSATDPDKKTRTGVGEDHRRRSRKRTGIVPGQETVGTGRGRLILPPTHRRNPYSCTLRIPPGTIIVFDIFHDKIEN
jgi:hypothetical protein